MKTCSKPSCRNYFYCKGLCQAHYHRLLREQGRIQKPTRAYLCWALMRQRCRNPNSKGYPDYGGRGITICDRWDVFANFLSDMGEPPEGLSIGRRDNDGPYSPDNCKWETRLEQANNTSRNRFVEYQGQRLTVAQLSRLTGIHRNTLDKRLAKYRSVDKAVHCIPSKS